MTELDEHFAQLHERLRKMTSILEKVHDELVLIRQSTGAIGEGFFDADGQWNRRSGALDRN